MIKRPSSRKTKSEILEVFDELLSEHKSLQAKHEELQKQKQRVEQQASVQGAIAGENGNQEAITAYTIDTVLGGLAMLRTGFGSATSELSTKLTTEASNLTDLRSQVEAKRSQLQELHGVDITEETLDELVQSYIEKSETFEEALKQERESFEEEWEAQEKAWQKEEEEQARTVKEQNEAQRKAQQRDKSEYSYDLQLTRQLSAEEHKQSIKELYSELDDLVEGKEKEWSEREKAIFEQELEYEEAKAEVEAMPAKLEEESEKVKQAGQEISRRQTSYTANLLAKEEEGNRRVYELRIESLQETIKKQNQRLESLTTQLDAAIQQAQELAVKSIEGSAHERSFKALKEIVLEQAKTSSKSK
jgi:hypothetical protein